MLFEICTYSFLCYGILVVAAETNYQQSPVQQKPVQQKPVLKPNINGKDSIRTKISFNVADTFTWDGPCGIFNAAKKNQDSCHCRLKNIYGTIVQGTFMPTSSGSLTCLYGDSGAGGSFYLYPALSQRTTIIEKGTYYLSTDGKGIYTAKKNTRSLVVKNIQRVTYDSREPYIKENIIFGFTKVESDKTNEKFKITWKVDSTLYTGFIFRVHVSIINTSNNKTRSNGILFVKTKGSRDYFAYNAVLNDFHELLNARNQSQNPQIGGRKQDDLIDDDNNKSYEYAVYILAVLCAAVLAVLAIMIFRMRRKKKFTPKKRTMSKKESPAKPNPYSETRLKTAPYISKESINGKYEHSGWPQKAALPLPSKDGGYEYLDENQLTPSSYSPLQNKPAPVQDMNIYEVQYNDHEPYKHDRENDGATNELYAECRQ